MPTKTVIPDPTQRLQAALARCHAAGLSIRDVAPRVVVVRRGVSVPYLYAVRRGANPAPLELVEAVERVAQEAIARQLNTRYVRHDQDATAHITLTNPALDSTTGDSATAP